MRADAGNVDDGFCGAASGKDQWKKVLNHVEAAEIIDINGGLNLRRIDVGEFAEHGLVGAKDAGIVDEEIQTTTMLFLDGLCDKKRRGLGSVVCGKCSDTEV